MTSEELADIRKRMEGGYATWEHFYALLAEVDRLREKNEIIKAYAGPNGMMLAEVRYRVNKGYTIESPEYAPAPIRNAWQDAKTLLAYIDEIRELANLEAS